MKSILTQLTPKEFFKKAGGTIEAREDGEQVHISSWREFKMWRDSLSSPWLWTKEVIKVNPIGDIAYELDGSLEIFNAAETLDPILAKGSCFSLECAFNEGDPRYDEWRTQRIERGFDDTELWNLDWSIARWLLPRLKAFRQDTDGYPARLGDMKAWEDILDKMILGLDIFVSKDAMMFTKEEYDKADESMRLLAEYFMDLWW